MAGRPVNTSLSLVVPAFNEGSRLSDGLDRLMESISPNDTEIIVVDDGSSDNTADIARRKLKEWTQSCVISLGHNRGKGAAVKTGVIRARGSVIGFIDADMATDPKDLSYLLRAIEHSHVAVGSRAHEASLVTERGIHREVMNRTFGTLVSSMTHLPYMDTQCGFKAFRGPVAKLLVHGTQVDRFAFDVEMLDLAARMGLRIEQVPVRWTDIAGSHVRPVRDGLQMVGDITRMRLMRRKPPPVQGVMISEIPIEAAGALIQPRVRKVDLIIKWGGGTAVFFPCLPPTESHRVFKRLSSDLGTYSPQPMSVEFGALFHPMLATGILSGEVPT
jgi:dolichyl-phosphate beta-glucosyltransferase